jgi:hypothetical protein
MFCPHKRSKACLFVLTLYYFLLHNPVTRRDPDVPAFPLWWVKTNPYEYGNKRHLLNLLWITHYIYLARHLRFSSRLASVRIYICLAFPLLYYHLYLVSSFINYI